MAIQLALRIASLLVVHQAAALAGLRAACCVNALTSVHCTSWRCIVETDRSQVVVNAFKNISPASSHSGSQMIALMDDRPYGWTPLRLQGLSTCLWYLSPIYKIALSTVLYMDFPASSFYNYCYRHSLVHQLTRLLCEYLVDGPHFSH